MIHLLRHMMALLLAAWLAVTLVFFALRILPGDAIEAQLRSANLSPAEIQRQREIFGLDDPIYQQYVDYWRDLLRGDPGQSLTTREPISQIIITRLPPTLRLAGLSLLIALGLSIGLGLGAVLPGIMEDGGRWRGVQLISRAMITLALAAPVYWTATLAIFLLSHQLGWLPAGGNARATSLILPALVLGFHTGGAIARVTETALHEILDQPYIRTARAKGLPPDLVMEHALRVGLPPLLSMIALQAGFLLSGTVIIEIIFTRRGIGQMMYQAVLDQDYPVVQNLVMISAFAYAFMRLIADALRTLADPRVAHE